MPHKLLAFFWTTSLALTIVAGANTKAPQTFEPYASPILHTFLDSANVYPESVTIDESSGTFYRANRSSDSAA